MTIPIDFPQLVICTAFIILTIVLVRLLEEIKIRRLAEKEAKRSQMELIEIQKQIKEAQLFLEAIVDNIPNMIFVKDAKELKFVRLNKAGEELLGMSGQDMIG